MANAEQMKALIRCHAEGDSTRFYAIAIQVAAQAARSGHGRFAQELRELVDDVRSKNPNLAPRRGPTPIPIAQPRGELSGLLTASYPKTRFAEMALEESLRGKLERVLVEQLQSVRIRQHGFQPLRKLLLVGPPGTGKTMSAAALAGEIGLPLMTIQTHALITKFMGETAAKLRLVFDAMESTRAVYFFDEFDALGAERGTGNDVGEVRRVLNSFLQFLEQDDTDSLILAATNHMDLLDKALFRRFDCVLEYRPPTPELAVEVMQSRLCLMDTRQVNWDELSGPASLLSQADIVKACEQAAKDAILRNVQSVGAQEMLAALRERQSIRGPSM